MRIATGFRLLLAAACLFLALALHAKAITTAQQAITHANRLAKKFGWTVKFPAKVIAPATKASEWIVEYKAPDKKLRYNAPGLSFSFDGQTGSLITARNGDTLPGQSAAPAKKMTTQKALKLAHQYLTMAGITLKDMKLDGNGPGADHAIGKYEHCWNISYHREYKGYRCIAFGISLEINPTDGSLYYLDNQSRFSAPSTVDVVIARDKAKKIAVDYLMKKTTMRDATVRFSILRIIPVFDAKRHLSTRLAWLVDFGERTNAWIDAANGKILYACPCN